MANIMRRNYGNGSGSTGSMMPFGGLVDNVLQSTLKGFFDDDFWGSTGLKSTTAQVPVNIRETDKTFELEIVAPGLKKEDFHVSMEHNLLTVSFEHKEENKQENKGSGYLRQEYRMQSFSRSFNLDDSVDAEKISAQYRDGVLQLTLPKKEGAQRISKNIEIQ